MLQHEIDLAVHRSKICPLSYRTVLGVVTERENPADALVVHAKHQDKQIDTLPDGTIVERPLRRLAQLRHHFHLLKDTGAT